MLCNKRLSLFIICLIFCTQLYASWVTPNSAISTPLATAWTDFARAYDSNEGTYASDASNRTGWGNYIEFTLPAATYSNQLKLLADYDVPPVNVNRVQVDVYNTSSASWVTVRDGNIANIMWTTITYNAMTISRVRFRYNYLTSTFTYWLYELAVWDCGIPATEPTVLTKLSSSEDNTSAILHGQIVSDGADPCQYRFVYGSTMAYGNVTSWIGGAISGQDFSVQILGLVTGNYYHYRAEAKNSAGTAVGDDRYFITAQPNLGWISPLDTIDTQNVWTNTPNSHDDDESTYASMFTNTGDPAWGQFLYLTYAPGVTTNALRFSGLFSAVIDQADVDILRNSVWTDIYQGTASGTTYNVYAVATGSVTQARIRFHKVGTVGLNFRLNELDFYKVNVAQSAPHVTLNAAMDIVWVNDLISEGGESTTKCIIQRNLNELYVGKLKINGPVAGVSFTEDYTGILVTKNEYGLPMLIVPSTNNSFGAFINNHPTKSILIEFNMETPVQPLLMLDNGAGLRTITDYTGKELSGIPANYQHHVNTYNYTVDLKRLTFYTEAFSTFSIGMVSTVSLTTTYSYLVVGKSLTLNGLVVDSLGAGVANAPVTMSLLSGTGTFSSVNLTTNTSGLFTVVYTGPLTSTMAVVQAKCDTRVVTMPISVGLVASVEVSPDAQYIMPNSALTLYISVTANDGTVAAFMPVTVSILSGSGTVSSANLVTDISGNCIVTYNASATYTTAVVQVQCYNVTATVSVFVQSGAIRYVPLGYGGVPSYNTIQLALNACNAGDIVQINYGTYTENLTWPNRSFVVLRGADNTGSANCIIAGNNLNQVVYCGNAVTLSIQNVQLRGGRNPNNTPTGRRYGGGISVYDTTSVAVLNLSQVLITGNSALYNGTAANNLGGGIYFRGNQLNLADTTIVSNSARIGGGIYLYSRYATLTDSLVSSNNATAGDGGGLYMRNATALDVTISSTVFSNNRALLTGGAIRFCDIAGLVVSGTTFNANLAANGAATAQGLGTIYSSCAFIGNQASVNGGVFYQASVSLNNCSVSGNKALTGSGGVLYVNNVNRTSTINGSVFSRNTVNNTTGLGGCFYSNNTTSIIQSADSSFSDNSAYRGGVFYNNTVMQDRAWLVNNTAANAGGVFYTSLITLNNSVVAFNNGGTNGGVAYSSLANQFLNITFVSNNATNGQVLFRSAATPLLKNSIIYGSANPFNSTVPVVTYTRLDGAYVGAGNITSDPQFLDPANNDFRLTFGSPCIDSGTLNDLNDYLGRARPIYDGYDMGAYEYADLFLSDFSPALATTTNTNGLISFRIQDAAHAASNLNLTLTVNNVLIVGYSVISSNAVTTTDMRVQFITTYNINTTYNVSINARCWAEPQTVVYPYWYATITVLPNIVITSRNVTVTLPSGYTGPTGLVPGSILTYMLAIENQTIAPVANCTLSDKLPLQVHFFGQGAYAPTMNGSGISNVVYLGPTLNAAGPGSAIGYSFDMAGSAKATINYSVTLD